MDKFGLLFLAIMYLIISFIYIMCFFIILKKERKKPWLAFIPFVNLYLYFKICKLPFWTLFAPIVNIIVLIFSPFRLAKQYRLNRLQCYLAIIFPFVFIPIIAFSKKQNIDITYDNTYIKSSNDIDLLEKNLVFDNNEFIDETQYNSTQIFLNTQDEISVDNIAFNDEVDFDDFVYDDNYVEEQNLSIKNSNDSFVEINDQSFDDLSIDNIDLLEDNIITQNSVDKNIETNIKEYQENKPTDIAIAFGGEKQVENLVGVQTKNDELKCSRCGSSLVGANGYCPGCGSAI